MTNGYRLVTTRKTVGTGVHHSGWPWVVRNMREHATPGGILVDDFIDRTMLFGIKTRPNEFPYQEPIIGIFHHADDCPDWFDFMRDHTLTKVTRSSLWSDGIRQLQAAVIMSHHAGSQLRELLTVPVHVIPHPIAHPDSTWSQAEWQKTRRVGQVGCYGRNVRAIFQLPPVDGVAYVRYRINDLTYKRHNKAAAYYKDKRPCFPGVHEANSVPYVGYNDMLCSTVVFMEILTGSANNVIIECIVRNTPVLVNRYPAVVEYLGEDYPLYYDDLQHATTLITDKKIMEAHEYLVAKDKQHLTIEHFLARFKVLVDTIQP